VVLLVESFKFYTFCQNLLKGIIYNECVCLNMHARTHARTRTHTRAHKHTHACTHARTHALQGHIMLPLQRYDRIIVQRKMREYATVTS